MTRRPRRAPRRIRIAHIARRAPREDAITIADDLFAARGAGPATAAPGRAAGDGAGASAAAASAGSAEGAAAAAGAGVGAGDCA